MDIEQTNVKDRDNEKTDVAQGPARARHDEDSASYLKPIIQELVRTQVCFPNIKLLVDKISIVDVPSPTDSSSLEAYLMYLTDREKTIQAVVKRRLYKWLSTFDVREGSYVVLKEYNLARGKRLRGEGEVFYLAISDFYSIGEEQRYDVGTDPEDIHTSADGDSAGLLNQEPVRDENEANGVQLTGAKRSLLKKCPADSYNDNDSSELSVPSNLALKDTKKRKREISFPGLDTNLLLPAGEINQLRETPSAKRLQGQAQNDAQSKSCDDLIVGAPAPKMPVQQEVFTEAEVSLEQPPPALQLSTLASITGTNASRNKQVNILAMIEYVSNSTVKPTTAPLKRDVRIVDPSTDRKVTLSVFIDPVKFTPKQYDIILFRDLTTHDFSGGNLNAYPKKCRGKDWCTVDPYHIKECDMKSMEDFRAKYRKTKSQERG